MAEQQQLGPLVASLLKDFQLDQGRVSMPQKAQLQWVEKIQLLPGAQKKAVAKDLIAAALHFKEVGGDAAIQGIDFMLALVALLLGGKGAAQEAFLRARKEQVKTIGIKEDLRPATERGQVEGAIKWSPLARFSIGKKDK